MYLTQFQHCFQELHYQVEEFLYILPFRLEQNQIHQNQLNSVEIGSNTSIDRATLGSTLISDGVKIDNLVQIAHNVSIGKNTVIAGQCGIAGSTKVGENCQIGGQVGIIGHLSIGNNVKINGQTGVFSNIKDNSTLRGTPAMDERSFNRSFVYFKNLEKIAKDLNHLKKINDNNN